MDIQWAADAGGDAWARGLAMLADAGVKGLVILALAALATASMRRGSAAARHLVWMLALGGILLLPALGLLMPRWQLGILPGAEEGSTEAPKAEIVMGAPAVEVGPADIAAVKSVTRESPEIVAAAPEETIPAGAGEFERFHERRAERPLALWLLVAWAAVALAIIAPLFAGLMAVARLQRRAPHFNGDRLASLAREVAETIGLRRPVEVLCAGPGAMPMAAGLGPVVFLPREAEAWPEEKLRAVLLHELAHVRRRDCLTQALAHLALAMHWFDPLAWIALRRLRIERERACDDLVLRAGERASDYAGHLLEIARAMHTRRVLSAAAITMAKQSQLEGRLLAVLDAGRKRGSVSKWFVYGGLLLMLIIIAPLAAMSVRPRGNPDQNTNDEETELNMVAWTAIVDGPLADNLAALGQIESSGGTYDCYRVKAGSLLATVREGHADGDVLAIHPKKEWLERSDHPRYPGLRIASLQSNLRIHVEEDLERVAILGVSLSYRWGLEDDRVRLKWQGGSAHATLMHYGAAARDVTAVSVSDPIEFEGNIEPAEALLYMAPMGKQLDLTPWHLFVIQPFEAPKKLAAHLRGVGAESWLFKGLDENLDEMRAALKWAHEGGGSVGRSTDSSGAEFAIIAVGRPSQWPHRWWNLEGHPVIPDPRWGKLTPATADLGIVFNYLPEGTCDLELRPDRPGGATYFETKGSTTGIIWFKPEEMRSIEERGVATELHVKTGTGPWEEIATINPDEVVEVGGDRFYLEKEVAAQTRGLTLVTCEYDLDPQWEIEIIAEDGAGNRTQPRSGLSFNAFTRREKREWTQNILMDKSDIDHFVILERALESHIIRDIPMVGAGLENDPADGDLEPDSGSRADSSIANEVEFEIVAGETLH